MSSPSKQKKKAAVLGAGSWGTALAHHLRRAGSDVVLWGRDQSVLEALGQNGVNPRYFPKDPLGAPLNTTTDYQTALQDCNLVVFAVPSVSLREVARDVKEAVPPSALVVSTAKGLEPETQKSMEEVLAEELSAPERLTVLGGPSFALEVLRGLPTAVVIAAKQEEYAKRAAEFFHSEQFRVYTSADVVGVEVGGAVKNVIALAAGVVDGVGMGSNARAALITRGIAEIQRLTAALGGDRRTVAGLSGLGDLLLTATGDLSRNRQVGLRLGRGESLQQILSDLGQTAEAVRSSKNLRILAARKSVSVPIIEQVDSLLSGESSLEQVVKNLLTRAPKSEL